MAAIDSSKHKRLMSWVSDRSVEQGEQLPMEEVQTLESIYQQYRTQIDLLHRLAGEYDILYKKVRVQLRKVATTEKAYR
ncbi:hypothetical protein [Gynurincola endophyticus]|uniref:hypothetical protein n=1 Tax=Gynurincola endophyticus TaxID=2479004 RepID=UPI00131592BB|nr:hypothetical protein [Gynurincola endophyticus]